MKASIKYSIVLAILSMLAITAVPLSMLHPVQAKTLASNGWNMEITGDELLWIDTVTIDDNKVTITALTGSVVPPELPVYDKKDKLGTIKRKDKQGVLYFEYKMPVGSDYTKIGDTSLVIVKLDSVWITNFDSNELMKYTGVIPSYFSSVEEPMKVAVDQLRGRVYVSGNYFGDDTICQLQSFYLNGTVAWTYPGGLEPCGQPNIDASGNIIWGSEYFLEKIDINGNGVEFWVNESIASQNFQYVDWKGDIWSVNGGYLYKRNGTTGDVDNATTGYYLTGISGGYNMTHNSGNTIIYGDYETAQIMIKDRDTFKTFKTFSTVCPPYAVYVGLEGNIYYVCNDRGTKIGVITPSGSSSSYDTCIGASGLSDDELAVYVKCTGGNNYKHVKGAMSWTAITQTSDTGEGWGDFTGANYQYYVMSPLVQAITPVDSSTLDYNNVTFNATTEGARNLSWCGLSVNGSSNYTMQLDETKKKAGYYNSSLPNGYYSFIITCNDTLNNYRSSGSSSFTVANYNVTGCMTLNEAGKTYTQKSNITGSGICIKITAQNVTFDMSFYNITGGVIGIYSTANKTLVKNGYLFNMTYGLLAENSSHSVMTNMTAMTTTTGIYIYGGLNATMSTTRSTDYTTTGVFLEDTGGNYIDRLFANTSKATSTGIALTGASSNRIANCTIKDTSQYGMLMTSSNHNIVTNSSATGNGLGIRVTSSRNITFNIIDAHANSDSAFYIYNSYNITINQSDMSSYDSLWFQNSSNITVTNLIITGGTGVDVTCNPNSSGITVINGTYITENVGGGSSLQRQWWYSSYVNDTAGANVENAAVTAVNSSGDTVITAYTLSSGYTQRVPITEYVNTEGTKSYYSNYTMAASKQGFVSDKHMLNASVSKNTADYFTLCNDNCAIDCSKNLTSGDLYLTGNLTFFNKGMFTSGTINMLSKPSMIIYASGCIKIHG